MQRWTGITRKPHPVAIAVGKPLRFASGSLVGFALVRAVASQDWTDLLLALAIVCVALASVTMQFEPSDDDL